MTYPSQPAEVLVVYATPDGEEREEHWPSVAAFLAWARGQTAAYTFTAYREDDDGEWVVLDKGRTGGAG